MPIGVEQWRMQIGALEAQRYRYLSRASRKAARGGRVRVGRISGGCLVGIVLCVTLLCLATSLSMRLLLAGDVERNPGPLPDELLSAIDNSELAADDLRAVYKEVHTLAGRWRAMCLSLGLSDSEMEITAATYPNDPHVCFRDVILKWLKKVYNFQQYGPPTWRMLIEAVADPAGGNDPALAEKIAKAHQAAVVFPPTPSSLQAAVSSPGHITIPAHQQQQLDPQETQGGSTEGGSHASSSGLVTDKGYHSETASTTEENQFPYLDMTGLSQEEKDTLKGRLQEESIQIMLKFQGLVDTFQESLEHRNVPVERLASRLSLLGALTGVRSQRPLLEDCLPQIRDAPNIDHALWNLRHYYSFFNYHVIEHIIKGLGTNNDKSNLQKYKEDLKQYSKRRCYECPSCLAKPSDVGKKLILKLDVSFEPYSVEQLQIFKCRLSQIIQISEGALKLCYIEKGCIQFTFQIPSFVEKEIFPLSHEQERALIDEGVLDLRCGEYEFSAEARKSSNSCTPLSMSQSSRRAAEESTLSTQNLTILTNELATITQWHELGIQLGVPPHVLCTIEQDHPLDAKRYKSEMLVTWLQQGHNCSWKAVVDALHQMGMGALANEIQRKHVTPTMGLVVEDTIAATRRNVAVMRIRFTDLLDYTAEKLQQKLEKKEISIKGFHLTLAGTFAPAKCIPKSSDMNEIFTAITENQLWDYWNYFKLEAIIEQYGEDDTEMTQKITIYKQDLAGFKATTKIIRWIEMHSEEPLQDDSDSELARYNPDYHRRLQMKLQGNFTDHTLQYVDHIWKSLSTYCSLPPFRTVLLDKIHRGCICISISWLVQLHVIPQLVKMGQQCTEFFREHEIIRVVVDDECIYEEKSITATMPEKNAKPIELSAVQKEVDVEKEANESLLVESELRAQEQESQKLPGMQKEVETKESENEQLTQSIENLESQEQSLTDQLEGEMKELTLLREELSTTQKELSAIEGEYSVQQAANKSLLEQLVESEWRAHEAERESQRAKQESQKTNQQLQTVKRDKDELTAEVELRDKQLDWERKALGEYKMSTSRLRSAVARQEKELEHLWKEKIHDAEEAKQQLQTVQRERDELATAVELRDKQLDWERKELEEHKRSTSQLRSAVTRQKEELEHLREENIQLQQRIHDSEAKHESLQKQLAESELRTREAEHELQQAKQQLQAAQMENDELTAAVQRRYKRKDSVTSVSTDSGFSIASDISSVDYDLTECQHPMTDSELPLDQLPKRKESHGEPISLSSRIRWESHAPFKNFRGVSTVHDSENTAFFNGFNSDTIYSYHTGNKVWDSLPPCPVKQFGLEVINGSVTTVGGCLFKDKFERPIRTLYTFTDLEWKKEEFPPMPTNHYQPATALVQSGRRLIVAGGRRTSVEILNTETKKWSAAAPLPKIFRHMSAAVCNDKLYLVGGYNLYNATNNAFTCNLSDLLESSSQPKTTTPVWKRIADTPLFASTCVAVKGEILAVGGRRGVGTGVIRTSKSVFSYDPKSNSWKLIGRLQPPRFWPFVNALPGEKLMVVGGCIFNFGNTTFTYTDIVEIGELL